MNSAPQPLMYGNLALKSRFLLSPLAGYTNLPFRRILHEIGGVGLGTTDLVNARSLLERRQKAFDLIATHPDDSPFAVQIFGNDPACMRDAAQFLEEYGVDSIDINMGCPVERITKTGGGSALMCDSQATVQLVQAVVDAVRLPVTVKMRL
ncbi:MAG: tRNA-dihydrouridine synthase, partial [Planctomycetaceae bacterium]|nr:tRNA-dihydrouridine synthase [Planctomycetaceae bacterium]